MKIKFHKITENKYTWPEFLYTHRETLLNRLGNNIPLRIWSGLWDKIKSYGKKSGTRIYLQKEEIIPAKKYMLCNNEYQLNQDKSGTFLERI